MLSSSRGRFERLEDSPSLLTQGFSEFGRGSTGSAVAYHSLWSIHTHSIQLINLSEDHQSSIVLRPKANPGLIAIDGVGLPSDRLTVCSTSAYDLLSSEVSLVKNNSSVESTLQIPNVNFSDFKGNMGIGRAFGEVCIFSLGGRAGQVELVSRSYIPREVTAHDDDMSRPQLLPLSDQTAFAVCRQGIVLVDSRLNTCPTQFRWLIDKKSLSVSQYGGVLAGCALFLCCHVPEPESGDRPLIVRRIISNIWAVKINSSLLPNSEIINMFSWHAASAPCFVVVLWNYISDTSKDGFTLILVNARTHACKIHAIIMSADAWGFTLPGWICGQPVIMGLSNSKEYNGISVLV